MWAKTALILQVGRDDGMISKANRRIGWAENAGMFRDEVHHITARLFEIASIDQNSLALQGEARGGVVLAYRHLC